MRGVPRTVSKQTAAAAAAAPLLLLGAAASVSLTVAVTRGDCLSPFKRRQTPECLLLLLLYCRYLCAKNAAALIVTSCKPGATPRNVRLLYRYLMHRMYGYPFREGAQLEDEETLFVPAGWETVEELNAIVAKTSAGTFDKEKETAPAVSVQPIASFLKELQQQHSSSTPQL
ncbi:hypothetical protein, conserved [Eimeria tenella]|uniref:Dynein light intermediate chain n=1 Tax=Eimeria tenella TaxID=5802 RepID=U6L3K7_EIMTE|nr:hypothetical protein, conserved [Eimeria tenella]CDJ43199.1 hypothetical protein, conserved [Eimeria tenella]|eukprot:XP_013233949.1 hypothetical protein, conserved [Eimeria tenella]